MLRCPQSWPFWLAIVLAACATGRSGLNSDLIEEKFGSYGVEIVSQTERRREASLYSLEDGQRVTRTWAVTEFLGPVRPAFSDVHAAIMAGASIGRTFREAGWDIRKQSLFIGELELTTDYATIGERMQIELPAAVAVHQYLLVVTRDGRSFSYARITEVHHPAYLSAADLERLYGEIVLDDSNRDSLHDFIGPPSTK